MAPPMSYDPKLEEAAQRWANHLASIGGDLEHEKGTDTGENLAFGYYSWSEAVFACYTTGAAYDYGSPGYSKQTGLFTQMVWRSSTKVGWATAPCTSAASCLVYVLYYSPDGYTSSPEAFKRNVLPAVPAAAP